MSPWWREDAHYLALDTSGTVGSVAVARGGRVLGRAFLPEPGQQSSAMIPAIQDVLAQAGIRPTALAGVVVGAGPGSFTGVRIAAATAKGLAHALAVPLWAFSSLAAGALTDLVLPAGAWPGEGEGAATDGSGAAREPAPPEDESVRWVLFDARGDRVYAGAFRVSATSLVEIAQGRATTVGALLADGPGSGWALAGEGALRHRARIEAAGYPVLPVPAGMPSADALLRLLHLRPGAEPVPSVGRWEPEYLKASSAERERLSPGRA